MPSYLRSVGANGDDEDEDLGVRYAGIKWSDNNPPGSLLPGPEDFPTFEVGDDADYYDPEESESDDRTDGEYEEVDEDYDDYDDEDDEDDDCTDHAGNRKSGCDEEESDEPEDDWYGDEEDYYEEDYFEEDYYEEEDFGGEEDFEDAVEDYFEEDYTNEYAYKRDDKRDDDEEDFGDEDTTLKDTSLALNVFSKVLDLVKNLLKTSADSELKKGMDEAQKNIVEGQNKMVNSGEGVNNALNGLYDANSKYTDFANQFSEIQSTLSSQLANIASMTGDLSGLSAQLSNQTAQLNQAQSRLDQAIARTDLSLPQKRVEIRSANYDLMQANLAVNDTNFNLANVTASLNSAGAQYNQSLSQASATRDNLVTSYAETQAFQNALNANVAQYNQGAQQTSQGFSELKNAVGNHQEKMEQLVPLVETSAGASGLSKMLTSIDNGQYAQATGDALKAGVDAYARNGGPVELSLARILIGGGIDSASKAVDRAFASGDFDKEALNFVTDFGQITLRTNDMQKVGLNFDLAYTIANNTSNPNRIPDAGDVLIQQIGPISEISAQVLETASAIIPGAQGASPAIKIIVTSLGVGAQGLAQTVMESAKKIYNDEFSAQVSESSPRIVAGGVARGLVTYDSGSGGATSAPSVLLFGSGVSIGEMAKQAVAGAMTNQNFAMEASATVKAIADTGLPSAGVKTQISAGSVTFKTDSQDVSIRPSSDDPVGGPSVAF
jgi:predicted  nucleic acid-binding Zn-ribbon protein